MKENNRSLTDILKIKLPTVQVCANSIYYLVAIVILSNRLLHTDMQSANKIFTCNGASLLILGYMYLKCLTILKLFKSRLLNSDVVVCTYQLTIIVGKHKLN